MPVPSEQQAETGELRQHIAPTLRDVLAVMGAHLYKARENFEPQVCARH